METQTVNIFATAKKAEKKTASENKTIVHVNLNGKIKRWSDVSEQMNDLEAEQKMLRGEISERYKEEFLSLYQKCKSRPESFVMEDETDGGRCMVVPMDKYISVTDEKIESFPLADSLIETTKEYSFNPELLEKYMGVLGALIGGCAEISDSDKANLLIVKEKRAIKKGAINSLYSFGEKMSDVFDFIQPIFQLKNYR